MLTVSLIVLTLLQAGTVTEGEDCDVYPFANACMEALFDRSMNAAFAGQQCVGLDACLAVLDARGEDFHFEDLHAFGTKLLSFGQPARTALLDRVINDRLRIAFEILDRDGVEWSAADIDRLFYAVRMRPAGVATQLLARTNDARGERLVMDLARDPSKREMSVWYAANYLFADYWQQFLEAREQALDRDVAYPQSLQLIRSARSNDAVVAAIAAETGPDRPRNRRLAALALLEELDSAAVPAEARLLTLADDPDSEIADLAEEALINIGNAVHARRIATEQCPILEEDFEAYFFDLNTCPLEYFETSPDAMATAGPVLLRLLNSPYDTQRQIAAYMFARAEYEPAVPQLRAILASENWRLVTSAIYALRAIGADEAVADLRSLSAGHWHPYVRERAAAAVDAIENGLPLDMYPGTAGQYWLVGELEAARTECPSLRWNWHGRELPPILRDPSHVDPGMEFGSGYVQVPNGRFEWRRLEDWDGELIWNPDTGNPVRVLRRQVDSVVPYEDGVLIATSMSHSGVEGGRVLRIDFDADGTPRIHVVAQLPGAAYGGMVHVEDRIHAASGQFFENRPYFVTVFDAEIGILGLAECVPD
ncbi:MAG: hypothetical protein GC208_04115 [Alphaproteobacteria bacterium]|nr:hypothetical protein [Alphaproteobacteria bacterium]